MKKTGQAIIRLLPLFAIILAVFEIISTNQLAGSGRKVHSVDLSVDALRQENELLEQRIASASSLMTISAKAKESGFIEPAKAQYLTIAPEKLPVAFNNTQ